MKSGDIVEWYTAGKRNEILPDTSGMHESYGHNADERGDTQSGTHYMIPVILSSKAD